MGHGHQTLDLQGKLRTWLAFRQGSLTPAERTTTLDQLHVTWLLWRQADQVPGGYNPADDPIWTKRYSSGGTSLYQLQPNLTRLDLND